MTATRDLDKFKAFKAISPSILLGGVSVHTGTSGIENVGSISTRFYENRGGTNFFDKVDKFTEQTPMSIERLYPHIFDSSIESGQVGLSIKSAIEDTRSALESYTESDFLSIQTRLSQIAVSMKKIHKESKFNESLGAAVSFIRKATLAVDVTMLNRNALNALLSALNSLLKNPMLSLRDATEIVDKLEAEGWDGSNPLAEKILASLLSESDITYEQLQTELRGN